MPRSSRFAFTLIELMVAIGLMSILGLMLIGSLRTAARIVGTATSRGEALAVATDILDRIEADLTQMVGGPGGRLTAGRDPHGRPFIAFVRTLPEERSTAAGYWSGGDTARDRVWNGVQHDGSFRAFGGTCEVVWLMDPTLVVASPSPDESFLPPPDQPDLTGPTEDPNAPPQQRLVLRPAGDSSSLFRAMLAPAGGTPLDLRRENVTFSPGLFEDLEWWYRNHQSSAPEVAGMALRSERNFDRRFHLVTDRVLHVGVSFWDGDRPGWRDGNPSHVWETAGRSTDTGPLELGWPVWLPSSSDTAPRSKAFPRAAEVSVTVSMRPPSGRQTRLATALGPTDTMVRLIDADGFSALGGGPHFVRVGQEWIEIRAVAGNSLIDCIRGARGTRPGNHPPGTIVEIGLTLNRIVSIPAGR